MSSFASTSASLADVPVHPKTKYVVVTGGVISGVGKGIITSSTGVLLKSLGLTVSAIKIDPYLNLDAGTLSPLDHGEVFILDDGGECDLDLGNYERFLDITLGKNNNITTGKIYKQVIEKERRGDYLGKTVQVVPHVTNAIQDWIEDVAKQHVAGSPPDAVVIEMGGTVGDIESAPFIEALRQFQFRVGRDNFLLIHVSLVPVVGSVGEQKTKPTQASVRDLRGLGLSPDIMACRSTNPLEVEIKEKIAMFCQVPPELVLSVHDCSSVYEVPLLLHQQGLSDFLVSRLGLTRPKELSPFFTKWTEIARIQAESVRNVTVALVGKYTHLQDSYCSVMKSLQHAALHLGYKVTINWIESTDLEEVSSGVNGGTESPGPTAEVYAAAWKLLRSSDSILVPGGFGGRGQDGKLAACNYARINKIPFLGICLGFQMGVIEYCRNVLDMVGADSTELKPDCPHPVIMFMPEGSTTHMGGTMRLGTRKSCFVMDASGDVAGKSQTQVLYEEMNRLAQEPVVIHTAAGAAAGEVRSVPAADERHRHRYEVNPDYVSRIEDGGLPFVGKDETGTRMEVFELPASIHPYYVGVQYHPEMKSRPLKPSPVFVGLLRAAIDFKNKQ